MAHAYKPEEYSSIELDPPVTLDAGRVINRIEYVTDEMLTFNDLHTLSKNSVKDDHLGELKNLINLTGQLIDSGGVTVAPIPGSFWQNLRGGNLKNFIADREVVDPN